MKRLLPAITLFFFYPVFSQVTFQRVYGGIHEDPGKYVQQLSGGGYMIAGSTKSYGQGGYDFYLIRTNSNGDTLWTRTYGKPYDDELATAQQTSDGGFVLVGKNMAILKVGSNGSITWSVQHGTFGAVPDVIVQTWDGGYIISGTAMVSPTYSHVRLWRLNSNGSLNWSKGYCTTAPPQFFGPAVVRPVAGGFIFGGSLWNNSTAQEDIILSKVDASGNILWSYGYGAGSNDMLSDIRETANGDIIVLGTTTSFSIASDLYVLRTTANGMLIWSKTYELKSTENNGAAIREDASGNFLIAGTTEDSIDEGAFLLKIDNTGAYQWARMYGSGYTYFCLISSLDLTNDGGCILGGEIRNVTTPTDNASIYVIKTDANGTAGCDQALNCISSAVTMNISLDTLYSDLYNSTGSYSVTSAAAGAFLSDACTVGINEPNSTAQSVSFPNPFSSSTTIEISSAITYAESQFELFDSQGKLVRQFSFTGNKIELNRDGLQPGMYFYRIVYTGELLASGKLIAE